MVSKNVVFICKKICLSKNNRMINKFVAKSKPFATMCVNAIQHRITVVIVPNGPSPNQNHPGNDRDKAIFRSLPVTSMLLFIHGGKCRTSVNLMQIDNL